jgi:FkbM family methyltransferase
LNFLDCTAAFLIRHDIRGATRFHATVRGGRRILTRTSHGLELALDPKEYVDSFVIKCGYYEEEVLNAISSNMRQGDVFWDVGANLGIHAQTIAKLKKDARVYAFEPNPAMAELIRSASERNAVQVTLFQLALDSLNGASKFFIYEGNAGRSSLHNWESDPNLKQIEVETVRGDLLVSDGRALQPNVMKIDVEGNEARVLAGMPDVLANKGLRAVILEDGVDELTESKTLLRNAGFTIEPLIRLESTHHSLRNYLAKR